MHDDLAKLHIETYNAVADEYEARVETLRPVTERALADLTDLLQPGARVLDVGCAVGYTIEILNGAGMRAEGIDIAPAMIDYARKRNPDSTFTVGDFLEVDYAPESYDAILLWAFIHLFPKETALAIIDKAIAITKPGGYLFTGTTKSETSSEGFEVKQDYSTVVKRFRKRWTPEEIEEVFRDKGLEIVHKVDKQDEFGKVWMDYIVRRPLS